jgi:hypothetical protein
MKARHYMRLYSPSIVLLLLAGAVSIFGATDAILAVGMIALAGALAMHVHAELRELR